MTPPNRLQILSDEDMERKFTELMSEFIKDCKHHKTQRVYAPSLHYSTKTRMREWDVVLEKDNIPFASMLVWIDLDREENRRIWWFIAPDGTQYFHAKNPPEVQPEGSLTESKITHPDT
jgi:hypothetical protein